MNMHRSILLTILLLGITMAYSQTTNQRAENFLNLNKPERLQWLKDAGFGMFIHFSFDSQLGMVISHSMVGASEEYLDRFINELPRTFNPSKFSADDLAVLAKLAGMKYMVLTTKHHSGYCLWDTRTTNFNIMNSAYGKDLIKEYVDACRKQGLGVGLYFSPEDFHFLHVNGQLITRDLSTPIPDEIMSKYLAHTEQQLTELMGNYGKIDVIFFDGGEGPLQEKAKEVVWRLQQDVLVTRGAISTPEQYIPGVASDDPWEACVTMGTQWQYKPTNEQYKSGGRLIEILIESRAKGGTLLLNVGPKPNGELPIEQEERLREVAAWTSINQEAVYEVRPWIIANEENIWFSASKEGNTVYAYLTGMALWPRGQRKDFVIKSVAATPDTKISVLGQSDKVVEYQAGVDATSRFQQREDGLHISVVRAQRIYNDHKWPNPIVVKLENVKPALDPPVVATKGMEFRKEAVWLEGDLVKVAPGDRVEVGFLYRPYAGFAEYLTAGEWTYSTVEPRQKQGTFELEIKGLKSGQEYEYRAIVKHPKLEIKGEILRFKVP